jgi:hypothetical protein
MNQSSLVEWIYSINFVEIFLEVFVFLFFFFLFFLA